MNWFNLSVGWENVNSQLWLTIESYFNTCFVYHSEIGSIISKKAVEKPAALVLDIKFGKAAFMNDYEKAKLLAENLVSIIQNDK